MHESRDFLLYWSIVHNGDWNKIMSSLQRGDPPYWDAFEKFDEDIKKNAITFCDEDYPEILKQVYHPPFVLFYKGDKTLLNEPKKILAVVGSREMSEYGERATKDLVSKVAKEYVIISGLAMGIDATAHQTAIDSGGKTIAVLGCGIEYDYPKPNHDLKEEIGKNHLIVSEYPGDYMPSAYHFPFRNRIIVGLSKAVLVPEAKDNSGTMTSVHLALSQGKDILCVPAEYDKASACNRLIREGAYLVENEIDIFDVMGNIKKL